MTHAINNLIIYYSELEWSSLEQQGTTKGGTSRTMWFEQTSTENTRDEQIKTETNILSDKVFSSTPPSRTFITMKHRKV